MIDGVLTIGEAKIANRLDKSRSTEAVMIGRYRNLAATLDARCIVFAIGAENRDSTTAQKVLEVLEQDSLSVRLLSNAELFKA